jgi:hypothetical protein
MILKGQKDGFIECYQKHEMTFNTYLKNQANNFLTKLVPRTGFEPARRFQHHHLKVACLPISTPGPF